MLAEQRQYPLQVVVLLDRQCVAAGDDPDAAGVNGRGQDRAVLIVTHDNRIFHLADRIVHIEDGRIVDGRLSGAAA